MDIEITVSELDGSVERPAKSKPIQELEVTITLDKNSTLKELAEKIIEKFELNPGEDYGFYDSQNIDDSTIGFETLYDKYGKQAVFSLRRVNGVKNVKLDELQKLGIEKLYFLYDYSEMNLFRVEFNWGKEKLVEEEPKSEELDYDTFMELFAPIGENLINEFKKDFETLYKVARKTPAGEFFGKKIGKWLYGILSKRPDRLSVILGRKIETLLIDIADNELIFNLPGLYIDFPVFKLSLVDLLTDGDAMEIANNVLISTAYFKDVISTYEDKLNFATTILKEEQGFLPVLTVLRMLIEPKLFFREPEYIELEKEGNVDPVSLFVKELYNSNVNQENLVILSVLYLTASIVSELDKHVGIKDTIIDAISSDEDLESFEDFLQVKINLEGLPNDSMEQKLLNLLINENQKEVTLYNFYTSIINGLYISFTGEELNIFKEELDDAITILTDFMHQNLRPGVQNVILDYLTKNNKGEILEILKQILNRKRFP